MSYGLQISASGVFTAMYRQDVYANNLANLDTVGFKPDIPQSLARRDVRHEDGVFNLPSNSMLEKLGAGALMSPNRVSFKQGSLRQTGNSLDVAIQGDGFFAVREETDREGKLVRLTRDGRFSRSAQGLLVMSGTGFPVLDTQGETIALPSEGQVRIDSAGRILHNNREVAAIQVVEFPDNARLTKLGHSLFGAPNDAMTNKTVATGLVQQFAVEDSGTDEVETIMRMTAASRDVDSHVAMIQQHDRLLDRAINTFGRVT